MIEPQLHHPSELWPCGEVEGFGLGVSRGGMANAPLWPVQGALDGGGLGEESEVSSARAQGAQRECRTMTLIRRKPPAEAWGPGQHPGRTTDRTEAPTGLACGLVNEYFHLQDLPAFRCPVKSNDSTSPPVSIRSNRLVVKRTPRRLPLRGPALGRSVRTGNLVQHFGK